MASRNLRPTSLPGIFREITGGWVPNGYPAATASLAGPAVLGGYVVVWPCPASVLSRMECR